jgi:hypothetical protein
VQSEYRSGSDTDSGDTDANSRSVSEKDTSTTPTVEAIDESLGDIAEVLDDIVEVRQGPTEEPIVSQEHQQQQGDKRAAKRIKQVPIQQSTRQSARLAAKPRNVWRSKDVCAVYSFHITMMKALRKHGREGTKALVKELQQIDDLGTIRGVHLTPAAMRRAIMSLVFFKEKYLSTG